MDIAFDITAGRIATPDGVGRYAGYCPETGMVTVEMENAYLVEYSGEKCYLVKSRWPVRNDTQGG